MPIALIARAALGALLLVTSATGFVPAVCLEKRPSVAAEFARSEFVVVGEVIAARAVPDSGQWLDGTVYSVRVTRRFRGTTPPTLELFAENSTGRFPLDVGGSYVLFVHRVAGRRGADPCGNSVATGEARGLLEELERLQRAASAAPPPDARLTETSSRSVHRGDTGSE